MRKVSNAAKVKSVVAKSRVTKKYQATIPAPVRQRLGLRPGDSILFEESKPTGAIILRRADPIDLEYLEALEGTLSEWNSENDDRAYRDL
ncbi:MAG TPA: AbrB/MazE/SpoVT family DNA-binding domain-containing protein [Candidatus Binataceae bacterium]|jgi:antitoxin PrlF